MQKLVWQNTNGDVIDLTSGNYAITEWEGFANTTLNIQSQQVPFQDGGVFLDALIEQRELSVTLAMNDNGNLEERYRMRRELIHILNPKLGEGYLIYTNDFISKRIKCIPQIPLFETHNSNTSGTPKASLAWTACDPYWEDLEENTITIQNGIINDINNNGDIDDNVKIEIYGNNVKNPLIKNLTTLKEIKINDTIDNIQINTNTGEKSVYTREQNYKYVQGGKFYSSATNGIVNVFVGDIILVENENGEYQEVVNPLHQNLRSVIWGNGLFVAVSFNGIITSPDGYIWSIQLNNSPDYLYNVTFGNDIFAISGSTRVLISTDGETWEEKATTLTHIEWVVYGNNQFCIIDFQNIYTTTDFETLTLVQEDGTHFTSLIYNINNNKYYGLYINHIILESADLINWNTSYDGELINGLYFCNGLLVACAWNGLYVSKDGTSWRVQEIENESNITSIIYIQNRYIITSEGGAVLESNDTIVWSELLGSIEGSGTTTILYGNGIYVLPTPAGIYSSYDGKLFKKINIFYCLMGTFNEGYFCIGSNVNTVLISADGINWEQKQAESGYNNPFSNAIYFDNKIIGIGINNSYISDDMGNTWQSISCNGEEIRKQNGRLIVCGREDTYYSINGYDWTVIDEAFDSICYGKGFYVGVRNNAIYISYDFTNWDIVKNDFPNDLKKVIYEDYKFIATGENGLYCESVDGINWNIINVNMFETIYINYANRKYYIVSVNNIIKESEYLQVTNNISKLTENSDMNFNLVKGQNKIRFSYEEGDAIAILVFRQRYIGV